MVCGVDGAGRLGRECCLRPATCCTYCDENCCCTGFKCCESLSARSLSDGTLDEEADVNHEVVDEIDDDRDLAGIEKTSERTLSGDEVNDRSGICWTGTGSYSLHER